MVTLPCAKGDLIGTIHLPVIIHAVLWRQEVEPTVMTASTLVSGVD